MATANEIIVDALEDLVVQADEAPIEPSEAQAAIRYLNDRMAVWDAMGIALGYTRVLKLSDVVTVPDGAIMGIKAQLSVDLAEKFGVDVRLGTIKRAVDGLKAIRNLADLRAKSMSYPSTLPIGSGNAQESVYDPYYSESEGTILTETGGSIALEEGTESA